MKKAITNTLFLVVASVVLLTSCNLQKDEQTDATNDTEITVIPDTLNWSERLALSIIKQYPEAWHVNNYKKPSWNYKHGLLVLSFQKLYEKTQNEIYFNYVKDYADALIDSTGTNHDYSMEEYNIDQVNAGKILFDLYTKTQDSKYLIALQNIRKQLDGHPRTNSGGFWHKKIYPYQMWLDGLYMGQPLYTRYTVEFEDGKNLNDIAKQFDLSFTHTLDEETGLLLHAWDESKQMPWADKETGKSPNFWSRSMGWYCMALVDVLDYFPEEHPKHKDLVNYLNQLATALVKVQDESGLWYQVTDMAGREGNYLEASGTEMFAYTFAKGVRKGYLPESFLDNANKAFDGLIRELVKVEDEGVVHITQICKSAGLGGNPYRDGSYEYYLSEERRIDDLHGLGPFILAAIELDR